MDTLSAYMLAQANLGKERKVFDWDKAARIIKERKPKWAVAGLANDFENTAGTIFEDGYPIGDSYTYLMSNWATPTLQLCTGYGEKPEAVECYLMESEAHGWDAKTKWPKSALDILGFTEDDLKMEDEENE